jgi:flotillin
MWELAIPVTIGVIVVLVIGLFLAKLYRRSTRDEAYVRTGLGGQKVVLDGGSIVLPVFHSVAAVNLKTLRLEVARGGPDSMITKDRMRVDIGAEFYLRVKPDSSSIALAAQTLGSRTQNGGELRELIEAKFVDGLRSVAATMNLEELQEQRATFVKSVQEAVGADIQNNGLELESVSLTRLDQSDIKHFNPSNFFDAHGLTTLTKITREREQERNQIVRTTEVNIAQQDLVARQTTLTIEATKREAELAQQRDIANKTAAMRAQTAQVEQTAVQNEAEYRIQQELAVANKQTEANQLRDTRKIEADLAVKRRNTEMERDLQIVAQESAIAVANKSKEQSEAQTIAETARALAIAAEEKVTTAKAVEIAERDKIINVIAARKAAETDAMPITVMAEAENQAATNKAEAITMLAKADADAATTRAAGVKSLGQAEAEVAALKAEARNKLSQAMVEYDLTLARINVIPSALAEAVKPIEKISDIRIFDTGGMLGRGGGNGAMNGHGNGIGLGDGLAAQLLSVSAFKPIIDKILAEGGFAAGPDALTSLTNALAAQQLASPVEPPAIEQVYEADEPVTPPTTISGTGKATLGPKT